MPFFVPRRQDSCTNHPWVCPAHMVEATTCGTLLLSPQITEPPEHKHSVWLGSSILAALSTCQQMWSARRGVTDQPLSVGRKCF